MSTYALLFHFLHRMRDRGTVSCRFARAISRVKGDLCDDRTFPLCEECRWRRGWVYDDPTFSRSVRAAAIDPLAWVVSFHAYFRPSNAVDSETRNIPLNHAFSPVSTG